VDGSDIEMVSRTKVEVCEGGLILNSIKEQTRRGGVARDSILIVSHYLKS